MNRPNPQLTGPRPGLLTRMLLTAAGVVMLISAAFLGAFFFLAAIGIFMVLVVVMAFRGWRLKREFEKAAARGQRPRRGDGRTTVEGEYTVITRRTDRQEDDS
jgi:predicted lipid-binding transport protein (Tim44 family)